MKKELIIPVITSILVGVLVSGFYYIYSNQLYVSLSDKIDTNTNAVSNTISNDKALLTGLVLQEFSDERERFVKVEITDNWAKTTPHVLEWDKEKGYLEVPMAGLGNYWLKSEGSWENKGAVMFDGSMDETLKPYANQIPESLK